MQKQELILILHSKTESQKWENSLKILSIWHHGFGWDAGKHISNGEAKILFKYYKQKH